MRELRAFGLRKSYGPRTLFADVDLRVSGGEVLAIYGPSGCGKTTLLRILAGLDRPDEGEIYVDDRCVFGPTTWTPAEDRSVGMVFQNLALWPHMSANRHLQFVLKKAVPSRARRRERVRELLEFAGLENHAHARPHRLSGGEQQRLALARAFADDRPLMLLDEPFSHLDEAWRARMVHEVCRRKRQGTAFVVATHHKPDVHALADRVIVFAASGVGVLAPAEFDEAFGA